MPQLHLPVQSGSDKILKLMNRNHTRLDYLNPIEKFRKRKIRYSVFQADLVRFPGETTEDHLDTMNLVKEVKFSLSYSFIYSQRPGTPATHLSEVDNNISQKRLEELQGLLFKQQIEFNHSMINHENSVLFENKTQNEEQFLVAINI